jgi:hypothetical protein
VALPTVSFGTVSMTFLCPICNEVSSSKHEKFAPKKKGKTWRERKTERAVMATVNLGFTCPCCKEVREMGSYNPFERFKKLGKSKSKPKPQPHGKILIRPRAPAEITALSPQSLAATIGYESQTPLEQYRVYDQKSVTVSWNDTTETRRLIMKDMVLKAADIPAITIQCMVRCWRARARVRKIRELHQKKKRHVRA